MSIIALNPATGKTIKTYEEPSPEEVKDIIKQSHQAFLEWRKTNFLERARLMKNAAQFQFLTPSMWT